ncbi:MAG: L,D-transpeptidase family protein [Verrucomicrobiae bacterium]|nr:L,D-transpeptidase family protein [Verrucomicrobiae bacterium]
MKRLHLLLVLLLLAVVAYAFKSYIRRAVSPGDKTVSQRLEQFGDAARARWKPYFTQAQSVYPPSRVKIVAVKDERQLQVYATDQNGSNRWIRSCSIRAASGYPGPKLKEGDGQVPEGIYPIESLNPNSLFHVSLRVGYPNEFDRARAAKEGRTDLGGDIMIHGGAVSIGCLAMGDEVAEDLFVLAADTGLTRLTLIITPVDFRKGKAPPKEAKLPVWSETLYSEIKSQLTGLPPPEPK